MTWKEVEDEIKMDRFLDDPDRDRFVPTPEEATPPTPREVEAARRAVEGSSAERSR